MSGMRGRSGAALFVCVVAALALSTGCRTSTHSGLPNHIKTVEVHIFQNKTMYKSVEAWLTRDIIDRINADPRIRLTSRNGHALLTGEIVSVKRETLRETTTNEPATVQITIEVVYSFYDQVKERYIVDEARVVSTDTGLSGGLYEASRGQESEQAERGAARQVAAEIVRRTIGMW